MSSEDHSQWLTFGRRYEFARIGGGRRVPNMVPLRTQPGIEGALHIPASNGAIVALDNLPRLPP